MVFPVAIGLVAGNSIAGYLTARRYDRAVRESNRYLEGYINGASRENRRYWNDYIRAHHLQNRKIRYGYRTGYYYNMSPLYASRVGKVSAENGVYSSISRGLLPIGYFYGGKGYVGKSRMIDPMYGWW